MCSGILRGELPDWSLLGGSSAAAAAVPSRLAGAAHRGSARDSARGSGGGADPGRRAGRPRCPDAGSVRAGRAGAAADRRARAHRRRPRPVPRPRARFAAQRGALGPRSGPERRRQAVDRPRTGRGASLRPGRHADHRRPDPGALQQLRAVPPRRLRRDVRRRARRDRGGGHRRRPPRFLADGPRRADAMRGDLHAAGQPSQRRRGRRGGRGRDADERQPHARLLGRLLERGVRCSTR